MRLRHLTLVALLAACGPTSSANDAATPPVVDASLDAAVDASASGADLSSDGGTTGASCVDVFSCYFAANGNRGCVDTACLTACDDMAARPKFASDAEALLNCIGSALGSTNADSGLRSGGGCSSMCNDSSDGGMATCDACVFGSCTGMIPKRTCSGGACSALLATCLDDE